MWQTLIVIIKNNVNNLDTVNELIITNVILIFSIIGWNCLSNRCGILSLNRLWLYVSYCFMLSLIFDFNPFSYPCLMNSAQILFMAMLNLSSAELNLRPIALWMSVGPNKKTNSVPWPAPLSTTK